MIIGFDLDGTYAADIAAWRRVVDVLKAAGHQCVLVTNRCRNPENYATVKGIIGEQMPVVFSCGRPKREAAVAAGYAVSVWVDDNPILVDFGAEGLRMVGLYDRGVRIA